MRIRPPLSSLPHGACPTACLDGAPTPLHRRSPSPRKLVSSQVRIIFVFHCTKLIFPPSPIKWHPVVPRNGRDTIYDRREQPSLQIQFKHPLSIAPRPRWIPLPPITHHVVILPTPPQTVSAKPSTESSSELTLEKIAFRAGLGLVFDDQSIREFPYRVRSLEYLPERTQVGKMEKSALDDGFPTPPPSPLLRSILPSLAQSLVSPPSTFVAYPSPPLAGAWEQQRPRG